MAIILEGQPQDRSIARHLAKLASDDQITYVPTGYSARDGRHVWHEMRATTHDATGTATGHHLYYLRADYGSYAGSFEV